MKKLVYIAAPYTHPDPVENTHRVIKTADQLIDAGFIPFLPHLSLLWHIVSPRPPEFWYQYDLHLLQRCDILLRLGGFSEGANKEFNLAQELKMPVYYTVESLIKGET